MAAVAIEGRHRPLYAHVHGYLDVGPWDKDTGGGRGVEGGRGGC